MGLRMCSVGDVKILGRNVRAFIVRTGLCAQLLKGNPPNNIVNDVNFYIALRSCIWVETVRGLGGFGLTHDGLGTVGELYRFQISVAPAFLGIWKVLQ